MRHIQSYIESKQEAITGHPFFLLLAQFTTLQEVSYFVPELTFWAMTFQDILKINESRVQDPELKKIARHHRQEDAGHERWFLQDKKYMESLNPDAVLSNDVNWLFSRDMQFVREAAYEIIAEMYKTEDEILNIVLLLTLESSGHIFFEKVVDCVKKTGEDAHLKYFSSSHFEVELAHELFEAEMERKIFSREIPIDVRREAIKLIDKCYDGFFKLFDALYAASKKRMEDEVKKKSITWKRRSRHAASSLLECDTHQTV